MNLGLFIAVLVFALAIWVAVWWGMTDPNQTPFNKSLALALTIIASILFGIFALFYIGELAASNALGNLFNRRV